MSKSLVGALPIYGQHLAELTGVEVIVGGNQAATDGRKVYVPFSETDLPLSFGYVAHECSHVRNTDMQCFAETKAAPFRMAVLNILEDIRIEQLSIEQYPGTKGDLDHMVKTVLGGQIAAADAAKKEPLAIVHDTLLLAGRWMVLGQDLEQPAKAMLSAQEQLLGTALSEEIMQMACGVNRCESTREVLQLADAIIAKLPSEQEEPQGGDESQPSQGDDDQQQDSQGAGSEGQQEENGEGGGAGSEQEAGSAGGDDGDEQSESEGHQSAGGKGDTEGEDGEEQGSDASSEQKNSSGNQPGDQQGESEQESGSNNASDTDQAESGSGAGAQSPSPQARGMRERAQSATEQDLEGLISEVGDKAAELLGNRRMQAGHLIEPYRLLGRSKYRSDAAQTRRVQMGLEQSSGLRQTLMGLLQAQVACRTSLRRHGKRIDTGRIAMLPAGETRVFRHKTEAQRHSAAIQFLLDKSGSMGEQMDHAEAAVYAVLRALENIPQVTTGAMSFPESTGIELGCALIKGHRERLVNAVCAGGFGALANGGTPLAQALWPAASELIRAKGERKILFVVTDGSPSDREAARTMISRCEASGIAVIALGFGQANHNVLSGLFSQFKAIGSVGNLKSELFKLVREVMAA